MSNPAWEKRRKAKARRAVNRDQRSLQGGYQDSKSADLSRIADEYLRADSKGRKRIKETLKNPNSERGLTSPEQPSPGP